MCKCSDRKPRCKEGIKLYNKMRNRFLDNGLQMDQKHMEYWRKWQNEHIKTK